MAAPKQEYIPFVGFVLDFETGGLKSQTSAITQMSLRAIRLDTFETLGVFTRYVYPYNRKEVKGTAPKRKVLKNKYDAAQETPMDYEEKALEYSAIKMDTLYSQGVAIEQVAQDALQWMKDMIPEKTPKSRKPIIIGQNIWFDEGFLCQMFEYAGLTKELSKILRGYEDFYGNWHPQVIDTIHLGNLALGQNPAVNSFKLELMCEMLDIELDDAHDAEADVTATTNVLAELTKRMRSVGGVSEGDDIQMNKVEKSRKHFKI